MLHRRVPAAPSQLKQVRRSAGDVAADFGLDPGGRYEFVFAVNEAVTNAIKYGRPDQAGTIGLRIESVGDKLICSVSDSGRFRGRPIDTDPMAERGRGLTYIALLMDQIELSTAHDGTTVTFHKLRRSVTAGVDG